MSLPRMDKAYECREFRYRPGGATDLDPTHVWFVTLHNGLDGDARTTPPNNYVTIQLDPSNGTSTV